MSLCIIEMEILELVGLCTLKLLLEGFVENSRYISGWNWKEMTQQFSFFFYPVELQKDTEDV